MKSIAIILNQTLNLHGDIRTDSGAPGKDENVFDITQGVAISVFVKTDNHQKGRLGEVLYSDLRGSRKAKYAQLFESAPPSGADFEHIQADAPNYRFIPALDPSQDHYESGFPINKLALTYSSGVQTKRDGICVTMTEGELRSILSDFASRPVDELESDSKLSR